MKVFSNVAFVFVVLNILIIVPGLTVAMILRQFHRPLTIHRPKNHISSDLPPRPNEHYPKRFYYYNPVCQPCISILDTFSCYHTPLS
jgi:hypothetical protein